MREIKFRGYSPHKKQWVYGDLLQIGGGCIIYHGSQTELEVIPDKPTEAAIGLMNDEISVVTPDSVGQFTGLRDKNKKEIYEGDIIERKDHTRTAMAKEVRFVDGSFMIWTDISRHWKRPISYWKSERMYETNVMEDVSIIGNIYENPKLIEK